MPKLVRNVAVASTMFLALIATSATAHAQDQPAMELLGEGSAFYLRHDYKNAIGPYQRALDLEKANRTLNDTLWRVLIDNLGMAYGITGDLKHAKETFEYGISKDAQYPLFYYNLACTYGEMDDMEKAIDNLKLAFERKANIIKGEKMPDPSKDSSFARFMDNPKFKTALKELN
jgi:tetratricopeptide (TPR) repeat protein